MKFNKTIVAVLSVLGLTASLAQARPAHRRHHSRPHVSVGFNIGRPVVYARPCFIRPCYAPVVYHAPVVVHRPFIRPQVGVSFGGPSFGFGFSI